MEEQRPWHRLFGLAWTDFFRELPVSVEMEKDLSVKKQLLDVLLIREQGVELKCQLPDGFEELASYNLITFMSHQEKLSAWSLSELLGHYVNLRKQISPSMDESELLQPEDFRLFAVSARYPQQLLSSGNIPSEPIVPGVYDIQYFGERIRLIVANLLSREAQNAILHLFSTKGELLNFGKEHYRVRSSETTTLLLHLVKRFIQEIELMPDALEEFTRQAIDRILQELPAKKRLEGLPHEALLEVLSPEERLEGLPPDKRLKGLSPEERLDGLSPEERLDGLPPEKRLEGLPADERLKGLSPEERLEGLSPEERETLLRLLMDKNG